MCVLYPVTRHFLMSCTKGALMFMHLSSPFVKFWICPNKCFMFDVVCSVRLLNEASGSLLDDVQLVNTLQTSKETANKISENLESSEQTELKIDSAREVRSGDEAIRAEIIFSFWFLEPEMSNPGCSSCLQDTSKFGMVLELC